MPFKIIQIKSLQENYEGDEDLLLSVRDTFLKTWKPMYNAIHAAYMEGDTTKLSNSCHTLKGSTAVFWPRYLSDLLEEIEVVSESNRKQVYEKNKEQIEEHMNEFVTELQRLTLKDLIN